MRVRVRVAPTSRMLDRSRVNSSQTRACRVSVSVSVSVSVRVRFIVSVSFRVTG